MKARCALTVQRYDVVPLLVFIVSYIQLAMPMGLEYIRYIEYHNIHKKGSGYLPKILTIRKQTLYSKHACTNTFLTTND